MMRHRVLAALLLLFPLASAAGDGADARLAQQAPGWLAAARVPGLAVGTVAPDGAVQVQNFGVANARTREPVTGDTVFEAASLSKPVFAHAVLQLADAGLIDLDAPLVRYLPGPATASDDARLAQVTARHVLSHRTGFPNWRTLGLGSLPIHFTPGERFSYSGEGFVLLAQAVQRITGEGLQDTVRRLVFAPFGMARSSFTWDDSPARSKAFGHDARGEPTQQRRWPRENAAASLHTTAEDYARFLAAVLRGARLAPATAAQMFSPYVRVGPSINGIERPAPLSDTVAWGLGWGLVRAAPDQAWRAWHWGNNGDAKAFVIIAPAQQRAAVYFANGANGLAFAPEFAQLQFDAGLQPAFDWLRYPGLRQLGTAAQGAAATAQAP